MVKTAYTFTDSDFAAIDRAMKTRDGTMKRLEAEAKEAHKKLWAEVDRITGIDTDRGHYHINSTLRQHNVIVLEELGSERDADGLPDDMPGEIKALVKALGGCVVKL